MKSIFVSCCLLWVFACGGAQKQVEPKIGASKSSVELTEEPKNPQLERPDFNNAGEPSVVASANEPRLDKHNIDESGEGKPADVGNRPVSTEDEEAPREVEAVAEVEEPAPVVDLNTWVKSVAKTGDHFDASAMPTLAVQELEALMKPLAKKRTTLVSVYLLRKKDGSIDLALVGEWKVTSKYWATRGELVFAVAATFKDVYRIEGSATTSRGVNLGPFLPIRNDIDGDGEADLILSFAIVGDNEWSAEFAAFISLERSVATLQYGDSGGEVGEGWNNYPIAACFTVIDDKSAFVVVKNKENTDQTGTTTTAAAQVFVANTPGAYVQQSVFALSFASARAKRRPLAKWRRLTKLKNYPEVQFDPDAKKLLRRVSMCPGAKNPALIVPSTALRDSRGNVFRREKFHAISGLSLTSQAARKKKRRKLRRGKIVQFGL